MSVGIHNLVAAIVPDVYCNLEVRKEVQEIIKKEGYLKAAEKAKPIRTAFLDLEKVFFEIKPFKLLGLKNPIEKHTLLYDNFSQALEPVYFWILDYLEKEYDALPPEKLIDNFLTSVGSAQFGEMGQRQTRMQEEAMKMLATSGTIIKSILNIIYDLKEFKIRLSVYDDLKSKDSSVKNSALLSLKQIWLDQVDAPKRANTSLKGLSQQFDYVTIIDAFMVANSLDDVKRLDLNDRVKRILEQRVPEFLKWTKESEQELRKRFEVEKVYLRNQVNSVKLYARWIKPYLKAARQLEQKALTTPSLINTFNTTLLELAVLGIGKYDLETDVSFGVLPKLFYKIKRTYYACVVVEYKYRSAPERTQQGSYGFRGRVDITFTSYALHKDEIEILKKELEKDDIGDLISLIEGATTESLDKIKADLDEFLEEKSKEEKKEESQEANPFTALFSLFKSKKKEEKEDLSKGIPPDDILEKVLRSQVILKARVECRKLYNVYKGANNMPSFF